MSFLSAIGISLLLAIVVDGCIILLFHWLIRD